MRPEKESLKDQPDQSQAFLYVELRDESLFGSVFKLEIKPDLSSKRRINREVSKERLQYLEKRGPGNENKDFVSFQEEIDSSKNNFKINFILINDMCILML